MKVQKPLACFRGNSQEIYHVEGKDVIWNIWWLNVVNIIRVKVKDNMTDPHVAQNQ